MRRRLTDRMRQQRTRARAVRPTEAPQGPAIRSSLPFAAGCVAQQTIVDMRNPKISETHHQLRSTDARSKSETMRRFRHIGADPDERRQKRGPLQAGGP
ncbi:hypothetical protein GW17_00055090 [Ensete ventricosum]|nr:hypothetical protein GW17_00055090 [Ensete ventricosum]